MSTQGIEIQDASGNVYYPHTDSSFVRYDNDKTIKEKIDNINTDLNEIANPSILINGDFRNPINQRGFTSRTYTGSNWVYGIDRWFVGIIDSNNQSECILNNGYISLKSKANDGTVGTYTLLENPKSFAGKTLTASFKYRIVEGDPDSFEIASYNNLTTNGTFYRYSEDSNKLINDGLWHTHSFTFKVSENKVNDNFTSFLISTGKLINPANDYTWVKPTIDCQIDIQWVKLEYGSSATPFYPRSYGEELALCQRYYEVIDRVFRTTGFTLGDGMFAIEYPFLVEKRVPPTVVLPSDKTGLIEVFGNRNSTPTNFESFTTIGGARFTGTVADDPNRIVGLNFRAYADAEIY